MVLTVGESLNSRMTLETIREHQNPGRKVTRKTKAGMIVDARRAAIPMEARVVIKPLIRILRCGLKFPSGKEHHNDYDGNEQILQHHRKLTDKSIQNMSQDRVT